ncbi:phage terminase small subunit [Methylobacillus rhizosphaerae]|uniref:Phage terminase small subunit n=1 Tax=Methylobacillus rhizosphaerae TaxID=551994 RepID=A0A238YQT6_9PROT|nr:terminase small subunit [Methylobacillus rhizosphaerae]SNR73656.1 phage terminase small subunit [Methylobacillus rhizosphaerae]
MLNIKQKMFCKEYIKDFNATRAAIDAGYSDRTAKQIASQLLTKLDIQAEIEKLKTERVERVEVDADYVVNRLIEIDNMDALDIMTPDMQLKPIHDWPKVWRQYLSGFDLAEMVEGAGKDRVVIGVLKKIKWPDKVKNLELLGRHFGIFKDRLDLNFTANLADRLARARDRSNVDE